MTTTSLPLAAVARGLARGALAALAAGTAIAATHPVDGAFRPVISAPASVTHVVPLSGGQALVAGDFTAVNGVPARQVARLNADGTTDAGFAVDARIQVDRIHALAVQGDGKVLIGGSLVNYGTTSIRQYLFRLNADGSWDTGFDAGGFTIASSSAYGIDGIVRAIVVEPGGGIVVGGDFAQPRQGVARLAADGSPDGTFDPGTGPDGSVTHIARQSTGHLVLGGAFATVNGVGKSRVARLAANGALDPAAFGSGVSGGDVSALALQADDRILVGGSFTAVNGVAAPLIARLSAAGLLDTGYVPAVRDYFQAVTSILSLPDKLLVGGWYSFILFQGQPTDHAARVFVLQASDGAFANSISFAGKPTDVWALAQRSDGTVLAGGSFTQRDDPSDQGTYTGIGLLSGPFFNLVTTFRPVIGAQSDVRAIALQADGRIVAGGSFYLADGTRHNGVARFQPDGTLDASLAAPVTDGGTVNGVIARDDGKLVVAGAFATIAGQDYRDIALLGADGTYEAGAYGGGVNALAAHPGGKVLAALFHAPGVLRLDAGLSADATFTPATVVTNDVQLDGQLDRANAVAVQADGKVLVGGSFAGHNGVAAFHNIARLNADGSFDTTFTSPAFAISTFRSEVFAIAVQADGRIVLGGRFSTVNGVASPAVVRLLADGSVDATFASPFQDQGLAAYALLVQGDGRILVGGSMQALDATTTYDGLVRLQANGARDATFDTTVSGHVRSLAMESRGTILAGGTLAGVAGTPRHGLARFGFAFAAQVDVAAGQAVTSAPVTIEGLDAPSPVTVSGGTYAIGCSGTFVDSPGSVANGQSICVRHTAAATSGASVDTVLAVGGFAATFTSTTAATHLPRLANLSTRGPVYTGDDVMIGGFIIGGASPKKVLITARGPSLAAYGVTGALANPSMQLFSGQTVIAANDDWGTNANAAEIAATGIAPTVAAESALLVTLNPGAYTAIVSGVGGTSGIGIVEVFEADRPDLPLLNISTRGQVQAGDGVMIGGLIIQGDSPKTVLVTARGPSLAPYGIANPLANPSLRLFSGQSLIAANDDFGTAPNVSQILATGVAPTNPLESAILITLNPGAYTAIVDGVGGTTGVGIVEVFAQ